MFVVDVADPESVLEALRLTVLVFVLELVSVTTLELELELVGIPEPTMVEMGVPRVRVVPSSMMPPPV